MKKISVPYGNRFVELRLPAENLCEILVPRPVALPGTEEGEIERALDEPVGTGRLEALVKPRHRVVILCEDITRPIPLEKILPPVLKRLYVIGVRPKNILAVMALGSHRPMTTEEIKAKVGEEVYHQISVINSEFRDERKLADLGIAPGGVRVWIDRRVIEGDVRIGIGSIVPHPVAGFTGGAKIIYPGVAGEETVAQFHLRAALLRRNVFGEEENLVRKEMEGWVDAVGLNFIINCVPDRNNRIYKVVAGHYVRAHREGVKYSKEVYGVEAHKEADIVVASSHPMDLDFWQASKAIIAGERVLRREGLLILLSPCYEGAGPHPNFLKYCGLDEEELMRLLDNARRGELSPHEALPLSVAALLIYVRKRVRIAIISEGLRKEDVKHAGFLYFPALNEAIKHALTLYGEGAKISILPYGGHTCPYLGKEGGEVSCPSA